MKIGIDVDGAILDYERKIKAKAELYDLLELNKNGVKYKDEFKIQTRYDWTEDEIHNFIHKYFIEISKETPLVAGAKEVINYLKQDGHELIIITARGGFIPEMRDVAEEIFERENLVFDKYYWKVEKKLDICKSENIDIMIDDFHETCKEVSDNKIKTLYFRDKGMMKLPENEYLKDVNNWGEIYRYIKSEGRNE